MLRLISVKVLLAISTCTYAADHCLFGNEKIELGASITVRDRYLVAKSSAFFVKEGLSKEEAYHRANSSDWTAVVLVCQKQYHLTHTVSSDKPLSMLRQGSAVLIPIDHQKEWVEGLIQPAD
ncbi:exported hypothetical protein [Vibrio jasicida]|uniref:Uncharacterized protein n=1 Tax=Vibrio jasicida TaxID=766224 RepID=A0AAU9QT82_9VIBR|nr:exported hypothetical protein [Vibrio jasicida]CAH1601524.1 exported hypothetical protein [Vibrio jasicida]